MLKVYLAWIILAHLRIMEDAQPLITYKLLLLHGTPKEKSNNLIFIWTCRLQAAFWHAS